MKKVLVADEDKDIRFMVQVYLRDYEIELLEARDGRECMGIIEEQKPDIVIMNYVMDKLTGYEVARKMAADERFNDIPVIMMTLEGFDLFDENPGVNEFLAKPFNRDMLMETIEKAAGGIKFSRKTTSAIKPGTETVTEQSESRSGITAAAGSDGVDRKKILVADDEPEVIRLIKVMLEKHYDLDFATTGEELVQKATEKEYDLIISDIVMPKLSGWKSVKKLRDAGSSIPVIFNSGTVKDKDLYETLRPEGPYHFVLKPFKKEQLLKLVKELIG